MREIKFRAWDKEGQTFIYELGHWDDSINILKLSEELKEGWPHLQLMQYTGLHDKNGTDVYEGDILGWYPCEYHVKTGLWAPSPVKWEGAGFNIDPMTCDKYEVIGNIYENGDLLK